MTHNILKALTNLSLAGLSVCFSLTAQETVRMNAHVPFGFEAGKVRLPAGDYRIEQKPHLLVIRNQDSKVAATILVQSVLRTKGIDDSYLVFHKVGNTYFLAKTWSAGNIYGGALAPSKHEREAANLTAASMVAEVRVPVF